MATYQKKERKEGPNRLRNENQNLRNKKNIIQINLIDSYKYISCELNLMLGIVHCNHS